jgi:hypothetical protein
MHEVKPSEKKVSSKQHGNRSSTQAAMRPITQILSEILEVLRSFGGGSFAANQFCLSVRSAFGQSRHFGCVPVTSGLHPTPGHTAALQ